MQLSKKWKRQTKMREKKGKRWRDSSSSNSKIKKMIFFLVLSIVKPYIDYENQNKYNHNSN